MIIGTTELTLVNFDVKPKTRESKHLSATVFIIDLTLRKKKMKNTEVPSYIGVNSGKRISTAFNI